MLRSSRVIAFSLLDNLGTKRANVHHSKSVEGCRGNSICSLHLVPWICSMTALNLHQKCTRQVASLLTWRKGLLCYGQLCKKISLAFSRQCTKMLLAAETFRQWPPAHLTLNPLHVFQLPCSFFLHPPPPACLPLPPPPPCLPPFPHQCTKMLAWAETFRKRLLAHLTLNPLHVAQLPWLFFPPLPLPPPIFRTSALRCFHQLKLSQSGHQLI